MRAPRSSRVYIILAVVFSALVILLSLPQAAPHRQRIYNLIKPDNGNKDDTFDDLKWGFQFDVPWFPNPDFGKEEFDALPHNWHGPGHETYATFYATRDASIHDPYFVAAQQVVYRVLWDKKSKTLNHPMTVFVAPFISEEQRSYFRAAGAVVREIALRPFTPDHKGAAGRLKDMFSKLEMWNQTEFSKITYLDSDAFPLVNVDALFDIAVEQTCKKELLSPLDAPHADELCQYTFAGYNDFDGVNAGVLVLSPNEAMYDRLVRESQNQTQFDNGYMEQALLHVAYDPEGPFPPSYFSHAYNGGVDSIEQGKPLYIVHHKLWNNGWDPPTAWYYNTFNDTWREMLSYYKSEEFKLLRQLDNGHAYE